MDEGASRLGRWRRWLGVGAAMLLATTAGCSAGGSADPPAATDGPATPEHAGLPAGEPPPAYVVGTTLHVGEERIALPRAVASFALAGSWAVLGYRGGRLEAIDTRAGSPRLLLDRHAATGAVVDATGRLVAWVADVPGRALVRLVEFGDGGPTRDSLRFPARPRCCDDPFSVVGIDERGTLYASRPATGQLWRWRIGEDRGPGASPAVAVEVDVAGRDQPFQVTHRELAVWRPPGIRDDRTTYAVGSVRGGRLQVRERLVAGEADFGDPRRTRVLHGPGGGAWFVSPRTSGPGAQLPGAPRRLGLPEGSQVEQLVWEDLDHVLLALTDEAGTRSVVRCDVDTTACEQAPTPDGRVLLPD